jgi:hypothetical protein
MVGQQRFDLGLEPGIVSACFPHERPARRFHVQSDAKQFLDALPMRISRHRVLDVAPRSTADTSTPARTAIRA